MFKWSRLLKNQKGQSEVVILMVGLSVLLGLSAYLPKLYKRTNQKLKYRYVRQSLQVIQENLAAHVTTESAWKNSEDKDINRKGGTMDNTKGLECLFDGTGCADLQVETTVNNKYVPPENYISILDSAGRPFVNPFWDAAIDSVPFSMTHLSNPLGTPSGTLKQGFTMQGNVCHDFDPDTDTGNDNCPIRVVSAWVPNCHTEECYNPEIIIHFEFYWSPTKDSDLYNLNINIENFRFKVSRTVVKARLTNRDCNHVFTESTSNYPTPQGATTMMVMAWGGGGAGAGGIPVEVKPSGLLPEEDDPDGGKQVNGDDVPAAKDYIITAGGGGGGGGYASRQLEIVGGTTTVDITIGNGGLGNSAAEYAKGFDGEKTTVTTSQGGELEAPGGSGGSRCLYDPNTGLCHSEEGNGQGGAGGTFAEDPGHFFTEGRSGGHYSTLFNRHIDLEKSPYEGFFYNDYFYATFGGNGGDAGSGGGAGGTVNYQNDGKPPTVPGGGGSGKQGLVGQEGAKGKVILCF